MSSPFEKQIWDMLKIYIPNEFGLAGLMGNLQAESGLYPYRLQGDYESGYEKSLEYTRNVDNGIISYNNFSHDSKGYGLAQWTFYSRKEGLYNYAPLSSMSIGDLNRQIPYLIYELQNRYVGVYNILLSATTIRQASNSVLHDFENPKDQSVQVEEYRENLSLDIYYRQHGGSPTPPTPPPTPPTPTPGGVPPIWLIASAKRKSR